jgi:hypothetical protein
MEMSRPLSDDRRVGPLPTDDETRLPEESSCRGRPRHDKIVGVNGKVGAAFVSPPRVRSTRHGRLGLDLLGGLGRAAE